MGLPVTLMHGRRFFASCADAAGMRGVPGQMNQRPLYMAVILLRISRIQRSFYSALSSRGRDLYSAGNLFNRIALDEAYRKHHFLLPFISFLDHLHQNIAGQNAFHFRILTDRRDRRSVEPAQHIVIKTDDGQVLRNTLSQGADRIGELYRIEVGDAEDRRILFAPRSKVPETLFRVRSQ